MAGKARTPNPNIWDGFVGETYCTTCIHYEKSMGFVGCNQRNEYRKGDAYAGPDNCTEYRIERCRVNEGRKALRRTIEEYEHSLSVLKKRLALLDAVANEGTGKPVSADGFEEGAEDDQSESGAQRDGRRDDRL